MSLSVEVAELMEHFQWLTPEEAAAVADDPIELQAVGEEMADVLCYLLALANALRLDLASTTAAKMVKNAVKYPVP
jgi:NTP pyrophosphatase (non-canonical NTP hydrolase)